MKYARLLSPYGRAGGAEVGRNVATCSGTLGTKGWRWKELSAAWFQGPPFYVSFDILPRWQENEPFLA